MTAHAQKKLPPVAKRVPHIISAHGHDREDPYYWMRDRDNPEVIAYLEEENAYLEAELAPVAGMRELLFEEIKGRIKEDDTTVPYLSNGYYYYTQFETGQEYPVFCRRKAEDGTGEEVLLNANELAGDLELVGIDDRRVDVAVHDAPQKLIDVGTGGFFPGQVRVLLLKLH